MSERNWEVAEGAALDIPEGLETPSLVVDLDRVKQNLDEMAAFARAHNIDLAPHVKTHRSVDFARLQVDSGAARLCVAKLSEAEHFVDAGFDKLVMAYPIAGEEKCARAANLVSRADLRLSVDSVAGARGLGIALAAEGQSADVLLLIDTGFHRTGVAPESAIAIARSITNIEEINFRGIITHEGHAASAGSAESVRVAAIEAGETMARVAEELRAEGINVDIVSVGSTTTVRHSATPGVTEIRPGIYAFNDYGQVYVGTVGIDRCAARVQTTVVSHVEPTRAIVDAGSKALSQDQLTIWGDDSDNSHGLIVGHPGWKLRRLSEEHGWVEWEGTGEPTELQIGQKIQILPVHICSVFHALGEAEVVSNGEHIGTWVSTARGLSK